MSDAATSTPALPPLLDCLCDAENLHGLILALELAVEAIDQHPSSAAGQRLIGARDVKALLAMLRSAQKVAEKLEADLGVLA